LSIKYFSSSYNLKLKNVVEEAFSRKSLSPRTPTDDQKRVEALHLNTWHLKASAISRVRATFQKKEKKMIFLFAKSIAERKVFVFCELIDSLHELIEVKK
jgi:hypothetical protein